MAATSFHLAQVNIGRMQGPLESPVMAGFVARLDEINALADRSPGFVWRLQTEAGNATYLRPYEDERILFNLSVWQTVEALRDYVYRSAHAELLRGRQQWFTKFDGAYLALWWVPAGHVPSIDEAKARLAHLEEHGPTPFAFTLKMTFPPEEAEDVSARDELPLWSAPFGLALLEAVALRPGITVLDVGFGTGFPALELAERLGPAGRVIGVDPSRRGACAAARRPAPTASRGSCSYQRWRSGFPSARTRWISSSPTTVSTTWPTWARPCANAAGSAATAPSSSSP